jgi:hypothetical protein
VPDSLEQVADLLTSSDYEIRLAEFLRLHVEGHFVDLRVADLIQGALAKECSGNVGQEVEVLLFAEAVEAKEVVLWQRLQLEQLGDPGLGEGEGWVEVPDVDQCEERRDSLLDYAPFGQAVAGLAEEQAKETVAFD